MNCAVCNGKGYVTVTFPGFKGTMITTTPKCRTCKGTGKQQAIMPKTGN